MKKKRLILSGLSVVLLSGCSLWSTPSSTSSLSNVEKIENAINTIKTTDNLSLTDKTNDVTMTMSDDVLLVETNSETFYRYSDKYYIKNNNYFEETTLNVEDKNNYYREFYNFLDDIYGMNLDTYDNNVIGVNENSKFLNNESKYVFENKNFVLTLYNSNSVYSLKYYNVSNDFDYKKINNNNTNDNKKEEIFGVKFGNISNSNMFLTSNNYLINNCNVSETSTYSFDIGNDNYSALISDNVELKGEFKQNQVSSSKTYKGTYEFNVSNQSSLSVLLKDKNTGEETSIKGIMKIKKVITGSLNGVFALSKDESKYEFSENDKITVKTTYTFVSNELYFVCTINGDSEKLNNYTKTILGSNAFSKDTNSNYSINEIAKISFEFKNECPFKATQNITKNANESIAVKESSIYYNDNDKSIFNMSTSSISNNEF